MLPKVIDPVEVACMAKNADMGGVEPLCINTYKQGGALLIAGATPAMAEGITSIEPASKAEKAIITRSKVFGALGTR